MSSNSGPVYVGNYGDPDAWKKWLGVIALVAIGAGIWFNLPTLRLMLQPPNGSSSLPQVSTSVVHPASFTPSPELIADSERGGPGGSPSSGSNAGGGYVGDNGQYVSGTDRSNTDGFSDSIPFADSTGTHSNGGSSGVFSGKQAYRVYSGDTLLEPASGLMNLEGMAGVRSDTSSDFYPVSNGRLTLVFDSKDAASNFTWGTTPQAFGAYFYFTRLIPTTETTTYSSENYSYMEDCTGHLIPSKGSSNGKEISISLNGVSGLVLMTDPWDPGNKGYLLDCR
jgi:hypothetical protein